MPGGICRQKCMDLCKPAWPCKEGFRMQMDVWSVISIILVVIGFIGGIWYEHK